MTGESMPPETKNGPTVPALPIEPPVRPLWRRAAVPLSAFVLGIVTAFVALSMWRSAQEPKSASQRAALAILDRPAPPSGDTVSPFVGAVRRIEPAVVNIDTISLPGEPTSQHDGFDGAIRGKGSGVILTPDGYIITNDHVIDGATSIRVTLSDGTHYAARPVGRDPADDLAVLKVSAVRLPTAVLGDSSRLEVGDWSIAVGNPLGLGSTTTVGVISALHRRHLQVSESGALDGAIQTDAPINRGNSGGALANIDGQLVGINTAILSSGPDGGSIGLGFAIPVNTVRRVARLLIAHPNVKGAGAVAWIGIRMERLDAAAMTSYGLKRARGIRIAEVLPGSPAALAGVEPGDILLSVDGRILDEPLDLESAVAGAGAGVGLTFGYFRPTTRASGLVRIHTVPEPADQQLLP
ncbi:MAG: trypsin-like peptidase domain-containing protein [Armatimonadetes bacterium]|nr:trypsin-like peptidase domain-containing protein [Armatimonadota bacterium]MDE2207051.1 trypsin-like peptidase domain-containing protein [Armatimonadota bacterium]